MSRSVELAFPCRVVTLQIRTGPSDQVTTVEDIVSRAVLLGHNRIEAVSTLLALPKRIVVDVIAALWGKGQLTVDFESGVLDLSDSVRAQLASGRKTEDRSTLEHHKFLFEPVTGMLLGEARGFSRPHLGSLQLPLRHGVRVRDIPQVELVRSVQNHFRREQQRGHHVNVLEVGFGNPVLRRANQLRWLHVPVTISRDPRVGRVLLTSHSPVLSGSTLNKLSNHLSDIALDEPDTEFVHKLDAVAQVTLEAPERLDDLLVRLGRKVDELANLPPDQAGRAQRVLVSYANRVREQLDEAERNRAVVEPVRAETGHRWILDDLFDQAQKQVVISAPELDYDSLREALPTMRKSLDRKVQIVFLWGRTFTDKLPRYVETALDELSAQYPGCVLLSKQSSCTEATFIVQDNQRALIGTHSPLGKPSPGVFSPSVLIESLFVGKSPTVIGNLLYWSRKHFPHFAFSSRIKLHPREFNTDLRPTDEPVLSMLDIRFPELPEDYDHSALTLWADSWRQQHSVLESTWLGHTQNWTTVELVEDTEHRSVLTHAIKNASRRLVIADDRIHQAVADLALAEELRGCRNSGAAVIVIRPPFTLHGVKQNAFEQLSSGANRAEVRIVRHSARLIVSDDEAVIGSYSPLSEGGAKPRTSLGRRSQLGVRLRGAAVSDEIVAALGLSVLERAKPTPDEQTVPTPDEAIALPLLFEAMAAGSGIDFGRTVVNRLADHDNPWAVVDRWSNNQVPVTHIRRAVAALTLSGSHSTKTGAREWSSWLIEDAWRRQRFVEAALLGRLLDPRDRQLSHAAVLTSTIETGPIGPLTIDLALELGMNGTKPQRVAGAVGAMAECLFWGDDHGAEALQVLKAELPPTWEEVADLAVTGFLREHSSLPLNLFAVEHSRLNRIESLEQRRARLIEEVDRLERLRGRFDFDTGANLHKALFSANGLLSRIRAVARNGPEAAVGQTFDWLPRNVRIYINDLIQSTDSEPMQWHRQQSYLRQLDEIVVSMRQLCHGWAESTAVSSALTRARRWTEISHYVAAEWDGLCAEASAVDRPYGLPLVGLLDKLEPLALWARENT